MHTRTFHHLRARRATIGAMLLLLAAVPLAAHAQKVKVTGSWADNVSHDQTFTRILVVAITPDVKYRCRFERFLAARLNGASTKAVSTCDALTEKELDPLTLASIQGAVEWLKADAVVSTSLVARAWESQEGGGRDTRGTAGYKATDAGFANYYGYYGVYGVPVVYGEFTATPEVTTLEGTAHVTTKVYATQGPTVVYTLDTKAQSSDFRERSMTTVTEAMAKQLSRDGLIK